jgi:peptidoglycan/xylan/chitin deacetylase (PgdA/CDA1 family)
VVTRHLRQGILSAARRALVAVAVGGAAVVSAAIVSEGGILRGPTDTRRVALLFTGHEFAEGAGAILDGLAAARGKGSFFFTGDFLRRADFAPIVRRVVAEGHYLGPHSDRHLLCCAWEARSRLLVTRPAFETDLLANLTLIERAGVPRRSITHWVPAYEWWNAETAAWARALGVETVGFTPGTRANADYTEDDDPRFVSTDRILESIRQREALDARGLSGFLLLMHVGSGPSRTDKLHVRFGELAAWLRSRGYELVRVDELLRP